MRQFHDLNIFCQIAYYNSISQAAQKLNLTPAAASAALKRLEKHLGVGLFIRSTRSLRLTEAGEIYLKECLKALNQLKQAEQLLLLYQESMNGTLRIACPSDFGRHLLRPWLDIFQAQYPQLNIQLILSDALSDIYRDDIDVALRFGELSDSSHVAFLIAKTYRVICASPAYLKQYGHPTRPSELEAHNCLIFLVDGKRYDVWQLMQDDKIYTVKISGNRSSNDADVVKQWAISGMGIANKCLLDVLDDIRAGKLIQLFSEFSSPSLSLHLVCPGKKQVNQVVILLRDFLRQQCESHLTKYQSS